MTIRGLIILCLALTLALPAHAQRLPAPEVFQALPAYRYGYFCIDYMLELANINVLGSVGNYTGNFADGGIALRAYVGSKKSARIPRYVDSYPQDLRLQSTGWVIPTADSNSGVVTQNLSGVYVYGEICGLAGTENVKLRFAAVMTDGGLGKKSDVVKVKLPAYKKSFEEAAQANGYGAADRPDNG